MPTEKLASYRESLFQWIWDHLEFDCRNLKTTSGKSIIIVDPGTLNHGAGPDFLNAQIHYDGADWYGSVEIHKTEGEWNHHNHQHDQNFNSVILHVVYSRDSQLSIFRKDGTKPPVLCLKPYINQKLSHLLSARQQQSIPCGGNITLIHQQAFEEQVRIIHQEYFNYKVDELLKEYDPHLVPSRAWKHCLIIGLYNTLGIPSNRQSMIRLAKHILQESPPAQSHEVFIREITGHASLTKENRFGWSSGGMRPASLPQNRIPQAAMLHFRIESIPFKKFLHSGVSLWEQILSDIPDKYSPGSSRLNLLKSTVFLPAVYLLGDLFRSKSLMHDSYSQWDTPARRLPAEVSTPFTKAGFSLSGSTRKLGLAHQYKRYCKEQQCHRCRVFKNAIRS